MITFSYKGFDASGRRAAGLVEAEDAKDARKRLSERGIACETLAPAVARTSKRSVRLRFPPSARAMVYRELAALLDSGVAMVPALEVLLQTPDQESVRLALAAVRDTVRDGQPLSAAIGSLPIRLTPFEIPILQVGESTGGMADALSRLAGFLEEMDVLREKLSTALMYPVIVVFLALLLGGLVMTLLLPRMQALFAETGMEIPVFTRILSGSGRILGVLFLLVVVALVVAVPLVRRRRRRDPAFAVAFDARLYRLPVLGAAWRDLASLRFVRTLALLLTRGVGLLEGLPLAARATGSAWLAADAAKETDALSQGKPLAAVIRSIRALPPSLSAWVRAGQGGGDLPGLLENAAVRLQQSWDRRASRGLTLVEIGLTLAIGLMVALVALAVILPILQMNKGIL